MKKRILIALALITLICITVGIATVVYGFNMGIFDTKYYFNYAQIKMPDGSTVEGTVTKWWDYDDSDVVQILMNDKTIYLTHYSNVVLMCEK